MDLEVKIKDKNTIFSRIILGQVGVYNDIRPSSDVKGFMYCI